MATYRIEGVKYNPANWAMLDKTERAACAKFAAQRERELNTIITNEHPCAGGPFDGAVIELHSMASAPIHVGAWVGHYEATNTVKGCSAVWVGTDGGKAVNTHGTSEQPKAAPEVTAKGFDQLRDLLADLAEDPAERAIETPEGIKAVYTIGRARYTIAATPEAAANLRARILKAKKWFADKCLNTPKPQRSTPAPVADVVADVAADTVAADVVADVEELATVAEPAAAMVADVVAMGGTPGTPGTGTPGHTGHATPATAHRHSTPGAAGGQRIAGKSGRWVATFRTLDDGALALDFCGNPADEYKNVQVLIFETGRERMATLQRLAREADTTPAAAKTETRFNFDGQENPWLHSVDTVQNMPEGYFVALAQHYENINFHNECRFLHCLRAGRADLASAMAAIESDCAAHGRLMPWASLAAYAVGRILAAEFVSLQACAADIQSTEADTIKKAAALMGPALPPIKPATGTDTPPPAAPMAPESAPVSGADGQDYTHPLKTSEPDYTHPLKTSAGALSITITRGEGPTELCGIPHTVGSFDAADALLLAWADTVRPGGCCDKVDFSITWPDGSGYAGCYELQHHATARPSLAGHMVDLADFYTGKGCPAHMSEAAYLRHMEHVSADTRAAYEEATRQLNAAGIHTGKARPVSCDLRDLVAMGLAVADLVGLGVTYCGDMNSGPEVGAIVEAEAIEHNPRFYRVGLMGRDVRPDLAAVPQIRVTIRTECGAEHTAHHDDFGHDVGARYRLDQKRHGAPYLAQLAAAVAMRRAQATAAKELEAKAHAEELARLAVEFAHLERASERHGGGVFAARNIRTELKRAFPGVKFSVKSDYSSVGVRWTDGPTDAQVCEVIGRFDIGASDSQTDYFYTVCTAFSELFGGVQYLNTYRDTSDELTAEAIAEFWAANFADVANAPAMPTPADWRNNAGFFDWRADNWQTRNFRDHLNAKAGPAPTPAKASKKAKA